MRRWVAGLLAVFALAPRPARAHLIYELMPLVGGGATESVSQTNDGTTDRFTDGFAQVSAIGRARYQARLSDSAFGYRIMLTRYARESGLNTIAQSLMATSSLSLTGRLTLRLFANGELTQTSAVNGLPDPATAQPQGAVALGRAYYSVSASEDMSYSATPRTSFGETLSFARLNFLDNGVQTTTAPGGVTTTRTVGSPGTSVITAQLYGRYATGRESFSLTGMISDSIAETPPNMMVVDPLSTGHVFLAQLLAGWGHEISPNWSSQVQAGPAIIFKVDGPAVLSPAGMVSLGYSRVPWFMSFTASQAPAPNLLISQATVTDQVIARVAMPLGRSENIYVGGFGSYIYARQATEGGSLTRAYDQFQGGGSLFYRSQRSPIGGALTYTALTQRGNGVQTQSLAYQSLLLSISGAFAWGPGTPPLFGGVL